MCQPILKLALRRWDARVAGTRKSNARWQVQPPRVVPRHDTILPYRTNPASSEMLACPLFLVEVLFQPVPNDPSWPASVFRNWNLLCPFSPPSSELAVDDWGGRGGRGGGALQRVGVASAPLAMGRQRSTPSRCHLGKVSVTHLLRSRLLRAQQSGQLLGVAVTVLLGYTPAASTTCTTLKWPNLCPDSAPSETVPALPWFPPTSGLVARDPPPPSLGQPRAGAPLPPPAFLQPVACK